MFLNSRYLWVYAGKWDLLIWTFPWSLKAVCHFYAPTMYVESNDAWVQDMWREETRSQSRNSSTCDILDIWSISVHNISNIALNCVSNQADKRISRKVSSSPDRKGNKYYCGIIPQYFFCLCVVCFTLQGLRRAFNLSHDNSATLMPHKRDIG